MYVYIYIYIYIFVNRDVALWSASMGGWAGTVLAVWAGGYTALCGQTNRSPRACLTAADACATGQVWMFLFSLKLSLPAQSAFVRECACVCFGAGEETRSLASCRLVVAVSCSLVAPDTVTCISRNRCPACSQCCLGCLDGFVRSLRGGRLGYTRGWSVYVVVARRACRLARQRR